MNATVTKSAKKSAATKKPAAKAKSPVKVSSTGKTKIKTVATKVTKKAVKKPAPKSTVAAKNKAKPVAKPAKKLAKPPVKSIAKKAPAKKIVKAAAKPVVKAKAKTPAKVVVKAKAKPPVKATKKPAAKKVPAAKKAPASAVKTVPPKSVPPKPAVKPAAKIIVPVAVKQVAPVQQKPKAAAPIIRTANATPSMSVSSNKPTAAIVDKIQKFEVSKVSEVATKTKVTPALPGDGIPLTEEQILKMGEKDYMNAAQLAFFKLRLQQLEKDLLKNAGETTEHLRETVLVPDPADRATIEEEHALELRTRDRERKLLKKVQQSIATIDAGEYGWCEETGEPIGVPRLLARPTATLSLEAQQRRELKQKLYGD